jgi:hypothetical protein
MAACRHRIRVEELLVHVLSVDLGTSNTVAVLAAHGRPPRVVEVDGATSTPSAVFAAEDGSLVVGREAERRARLDPSRFEPHPKRRIDEGQLLLGDVVVPVTDALAAVLRHVVAEVTRQLGGARPDRVLLTHPAQWGPVRRDALLTAARSAGLVQDGGGLELVAEPVAAAAHFASFPGRTLLPGQALAVYDLGAGTFDCAVVGAGVGGFTVLAEGGLPDFGGLDVDQALAEHLGRQVSIRDPTAWQRLLRPVSTADRRAQRTLAQDVRAAKEALSRHPQTEVPLPEPFQDVLITRGELEALIRPGLLRSVEVLSAAIAAARQASPGLAGIYLVGGSSRIPLVGRLIGERLRVVATSLDQPETAVALGAHHLPGAPLEQVRPGATGPSLSPHPSGAAVSAAAATPSSFYAGSYGRAAGPVATPAGGTAAPTAAGPGGAPTAAAVAGRAAPPVPRRRRRVVWPAAVAALVVLVATTLIVVLANRNTSGLPSASDCSSAGQPDSGGLTPCMRQLAGTLADRGRCHTGESEGLRDRPSGVVATCAVPDTGDQVVVYEHALTISSVQQSATALSAGRGAQIQAAWSGNGLTGRFIATVTGSTGQVVFTVDDRPLMGVLLVRGNNVPGSADSMADLFQTSVQPGT